VRALVVLAIVTRALASICLLLWVSSAAGNDEPWRREPRDRDMGPSGKLRQQQRVADAALELQRRREIVAAVAAHLGSLERCRRASPAERGWLRLTLSLNARGAVTRATLVEDQVDDPKVSACVLAAARRWRLSLRRPEVSFSLSFDPHAAAEAGTLAVPE
jgi:hypothetical protein